MDNTALVYNNVRPSDRSPHSAPFRFKNTFLTIQYVEKSPTVSEASTFSSHPIGQSLAHFGLPREVEEVILQPGNLKLPQNTNLSLTDGNFFVDEEVKNVIHHL